MFDFITDKVSSLPVVSETMEGLRTKSIQELPMQGDLWYYMPERIEEGVTFGAEYGLTYNGWKFAAITLGGLMVLHFATKGR